MHEITTDITSIKSTSRTKWDKIVNQKTLTSASKEIFTTAKKLSKLTALLKYKNTIKAENYIKDLRRSEAINIFKLRTRMTKLKNNFKNGNIDLHCDRCRTNLDDENHLFGNCDKLRTLYEHHKITNYEEIFKSDTTIERLITISNFIDNAIQ